MEYNTLQERAEYFNIMMKKYNKYENKHDEYSQEQQGFISGELYEAHEQLMAICRKENAYDEIMKFFKDNCPNTYEYVKSKEDKFNNMYDILRNITKHSLNYLYLDDFYFPVDCTSAINL